MELFLIPDHMHDRSQAWVGSTRECKWWFLILFEVASFHEHLDDSSFSSRTGNQDPTPSEYWQPIPMQSCLDFALSEDEESSILTAKHNCLRILISFTTNVTESIQVNHSNLANLNRVPKSVVWLWYAAKYNVSYLFAALLTDGLNSILPCVLCSPEVILSRE